MEKRKNYIPYAPVGRVGTTKIKDTTVFAEDMYILYKQYLCFFFFITFTKIE